MQTGKNPKPKSNPKKIPSKSYSFEDFIQLQKPDFELTQPLGEILNFRKSERNFSKITLEQLSSLLWFSAKVKNIKISETDLILTHRTSPSAGAIHPIDILVSLPDSFENRFLYYYDPFNHRLNKLILDKAKLESFFFHVNMNLSLSNATLIWFLADVERTESKYKNPVSLIWRDAGALIMTIQLVATALEMNSCAIGTLGEPYISDIFQKYGNYFSAGGILLG